MRRTCGDQTTGNLLVRTSARRQVPRAVSPGGGSPYLETLAREADEDVDENLTKAEASKRIEALQQKDRPRPVTDGRAPLDQAGAAATNRACHRARTSALAPLDSK